MEIEKKHWMQNPVICPIDGGEFIAGNHNGPGEAEGTSMRGEIRR